MIASAYLNKKIASRAGIVFFNAFRQVLVPAFGLLISWIVLHKAEVGLWGEFVYFYAIVQLGGNILDFGNKDLLLREISADPKLTSKLWQSSLVSRCFLLLVPFTWIAILNTSFEIKLLLFAWIFIRFLQQSFEVFIIYFKAFRLSTFIEVTGIAFIICPSIFLGNALDLYKLILLFLIAAFVKLIFSAWYFREHFITAKFKAGFNKKYIWSALPFFLLGFSGLLQSRADILIIKQYLPTEQLGYYQVLINLLFFAHTFPNILLLPFVKNIYRINNKASQKIGDKLILLSPVLIIPSLLFIYLLMRFFYGITLDISIFFWAAIFLFPAYFYSPLVYRFFKLKKQNRVIFINLFGFVINILINIYLLPLFGIEGAVIACALAQWGILLGYIFYNVTDKEKQIVKNHRFS